MQLNYDLADVFTEQVLRGNQLAVFSESDHPLNDRLMQDIAREMNLSETVFLGEATERGANTRVRLLSTVCEVDFAGHPLLGTACILAQQREEETAALVIETNVGTVPVTTHRLGEDRFEAWMDQPLPHISPIPDAQIDDLLHVLGIKKSLLPVVQYDAGIPHLYLMADSAEAVHGIEPNFPALGRAAGPGRPRINVFALTGPNTVKTRMFSPFDKVPEDPACGSAAGPLAAHLVRHGLLPSRTQVTISQGDDIGRPSTLYAQATVAGDTVEAIRVGGGVCLVGRGVLRLPDRLRPAQPEPGTASSG